MLLLEKISLEVKPEIDNICNVENSRSADYCFGNIYMWDKRFNQSVAVCGDRLITLLHRKGEKHFAFPIGSGDIVPAIDAMKEYCRSKSLPLKISGVCDEHLELLSSAFPDEFKITEDRDFSDYIYDIDKLCDYPGKHLHAKRNYCNRFEQQYSWRFVPLTKELIPACIEMLDKWNAESIDRLNNNIEYEYDAIMRCFENFDFLGLEGGVLYVDDNIVGFTVGELINSDTFCIHFEKAFSDISGAYPIVCREMARRIKQMHPSVRYVNREDDMGNPSLRKSKLSYKPQSILKKYIAVWKEL